MTHALDGPPTPTPENLHLWTAAHDCTDELQTLNALCPLFRAAPPARSIILKHMITVALIERKKAQCELRKRIAPYCTPSQE